MKPTSVTVLATSPVPAGFGAPSPSETAEGSQYPTLVRMKGAPDGERHVTLDVNALAEGHEYTQLGTYNVSPSHRYLLYSVDHDGSARSRQ